MFLCITTNEETAMIYENKLFNYSSQNCNNVSAEDFCNIYGFPLTSYKLIGQFKKSTVIISEIIFKNYIRFSNLLNFISSAICHSEYIVKYTLSPPFTTSKNDCEALLELLYNIKVLNEFYYSSISKSFLIYVNSDNSITISDLVNLGLSASLRRMCDENAEILFNVTYESNDIKKQTDVLLRKNEKIFLFNVECAAGLESDIDTHDNQLKKLKNKVMKSEYIENQRNIKEFFVVTPHTSLLLPYFESIVTIDNVVEVISKML